MKKVLIIIGIILLLGIGAYFVFNRKNSPKIVPGETQNQGTTNTQEESVPYPFLGDMDGDGIADQDEKELGTSDYEYDTDGDGIADKDEIDVWKTDPTKVDTDGDGFADGYEILNGFDPLGPGKLEN
ncbi:MAG: hypothetical protein COV59_01760 [Candidatus Magasanikbacteria bacterium CG11_big_fil_rev_8_21_14_0_20_39_34]|uniref:EF-hand domain-containing protein n=1 Tax=Candidatus Magasanikbacteria bacterium CG11_big_fil_rev_8_21_14_0_20_39_34 TaxID=1974653 RepID=A0A2H0N4S5_9BACT|nr:MAG: hypothetical protein COV59_01760 [Candidatus Magasanikbacteria bacterium CG11_big_fil_rev_8_21_14_0_20_39_34]